MYIQIRTTLACGKFPICLPFAGEKLCNLPRALRFCVGDHRLSTMARLAISMENIASLLCFPDCEIAKLLGITGASLVCAYDISMSGT